MSSKSEKLQHKAIQAIEKEGALLVFPMKNQRLPISLWSVLHPRSSMRWEWDEEGDGKVFALWRLREELSRSSEVIYSKWYQGRATFFSKELFTNLLAYLRARDEELPPLTREARSILDVLEMDSPMSTKKIKEAVELQGRFLEGIYTKSMKQLWSRLLILGYGEVEDSSFPSLKSK